MEHDAGELYGPGPRALQDDFDTRRLADRLVDITVNDMIDDRARSFIEAASYFYLATVDHDGFPDVSYKGGRPGFVRVVNDTTLQFPSYDGNGMFRSLGNIVDSGRVALLFIRQNDRPGRVRIHGTAKVQTDPALVSTFAGAEAVVEVSVGRAFVNCPRYVHDLAAGELSPHAPAPGYEPPQPEWKQWPEFADVVPGAGSGGGSGEGSA